MNWGDAHLVCYREERSKVIETYELKECDFSQIYLQIRKISNFSGVSFCTGLFTTVQGLTFYLCE